MIAVFDCFSGISGDMTVGAFLDAGMDFQYLKQELKKIKIGDYSLSQETVIRRGLCGTLFTVTQPHHHHHHHGEHHVHGVTFSVIQERIAESGLSENVKAKALHIFSVLAEAEAKVHGKSIADVHFHEVGAVDSIVDIISMALCLDYFKITKVYVRSLHTGCGVLHGSSHGTFPLPAPATAKLLRGFKVTSTNIEKELVTPTGAAFLAAFAERQVHIPDAVISKTAFGAGSRDNPERANLLRLVLMEESAIKSAAHCRVLESCVDDMSPELINNMFDCLFDAGALDVFVDNILMKKNRPAYKVTAIFNVEKEADVLNAFFSSSTSIGLRLYDVARVVLERRIFDLEYKGHTIKIKAARLPSKQVRFKPEYDDCKCAADGLGMSLKDVYDELLILVKHDENYSDIF